MTEPGRKSTKILLTGAPGCGKTSLIKRLLPEFRAPVAGFITEEIREAGHRTGFKIVGVSGRNEILAHSDIDSGHRVGKYGVDVGALDRILESEFTEPLAHLTVVDEIGKMELLSERFILLIERLWKSDCLVIATILASPHKYCDKLKNDPTAEVLNLTRQNSEEVFVKLCNISRGWRVC